MCGFLCAIARRVVVAVAVASVAQGVSHAAAGPDGRSTPARSAAKPLALQLEAAKSWPEVWQALASDPRFVKQYWGRAPFKGQLHPSVGCFSLEQVRAASAAGELLAGQNAFLVKNPETFETVSSPRRGVLITPEILEAGLSNGTMVLNDAASAWRDLFDIAGSGVRALQLPVGINVYITHSHIERSTPLHTDRQDVVVVQCEGRKHWRVHGPPIPMPAEHQERGKSGDKVDPSSAGPLLLETTLVPGELIYVPRGFLHSTSRPLDLFARSPASETAAGSFSTSLTIGIQTESMGLTYDKLLLCGLFLHGEGPNLEELRQLTTSHELLRRPLPLPGAPLLTPESGGDGAVPTIEGLDVAVATLLANWRTLMPRSRPPPLSRFRKAARIMEAGHRRTVEEYQARMFDASVPSKLRQEVWKRRYSALLYGTLGRCGFLTRCFPTKFWLPKHTTHQCSWGTKPGR